MFKSKFSVFSLLLVLLVCLLSGCDNSNNIGLDFNAKKNLDAQPIIWIGDFNNFDDAVALMLIAKDPRYTIELAVVEDSFNTVSHGANTVYNILEWLGNRNTKVIRGAYFAPEEIHFGANGKALEDMSVANEEPVVKGVLEYQLPESKIGGKWNLERRNVMGINLYGQYVPGPWRDNGSTLYATDHLIPRAQQGNYHYSGNNGVSFNFEMAEDVILRELETLENVVIFNTGKLTTFARVLSKVKSTHLDKIDKVIMMGGGFEGEKPFTAANGRSHNKGGNIFSHPTFGHESDFSTDQEFNILLDPVSAKVTFDLLARHNIESYLIPTNSTDLAKLESATIKALATKNSTPEACYTSKLFASIREFEGGDFPMPDGTPSGDFALDAVIRLWDIIAALVLLNPDELEMDVRQSYVMVDQLNQGLEDSEFRYDPISFDPTVGKTELSENGIGKKINIVLGINQNAAREMMIKRLRDNENSAAFGPSCGR